MKFFSSLLIGLIIIDDDQFGVIFYAFLRCGTEKRGEKNYGEGKFEIEMKCKEFFDEAHLRGDYHDSLLFSSYK